MQINWKFLYALAGTVMLLVALLGLIGTTGCISLGKNIVKEVTATPIPTIAPMPVPTIIRTTPPAPTPVITVPPVPQAFVDPYSPGERSFSQWFKWLRNDVLGRKDLSVGIIPYRYRWMDKYTWYNAVEAQYFSQAPAAGSRYFVIWVNEEMFGDNESFDPRMWGFDETAFRLQVKDRLYSIEATHNPVNRIKEFDQYTDYYKVATAPPFSYEIVYTGHSPKTGGFTAQRKGWLRMGQGNAFDGYLIFEIPKDSQEKDIRLLGNFASFGSANWKLG